MKTLLFRSCIIVITALAFSQISHAELFKWTDKNGKVHYSDKEPQTDVKARTVPLKPFSSNDSGSSSSANAIIRPYNKSSRKLLIVDTLYSWKNSDGAQQKRKIGTYHVGKGCTSRGSIKIPDVYLSHNSFIPTEIQVAIRIQKVIKSLDYDSERVDKFKLLEQLKKTGGLSLHSEIVEMDLNSCAQNVSTNERLKKPEKT